MDDKELGYDDYHEALHACWMLMDSFDNYVVTHPAIEGTPELAAAAATAFEALHACYQQIGARFHLPAANPPEGRTNTQVTLQDFELFDERAAQGLAVARAVDHEKPIPGAVTTTSGA